MKKFMLLLALTGISATTLLAQDKQQGRIDYDVTLNVRAALKPDQQQFKDLVPETMISREMLFFNGNKTRLARKDPEETTSEEGAKIKMVSNEGQIAVYTDGSAGKAWSLMEEDGKKLLVPQSDNNLGKDKTGARTRQILGFTCREVLTKRGDGPTTLWVTDELPFSAGPMGMLSGKGAILGLDSKKMNIIATAISYVPVTKEDVSIPADVPVKETK
ncbi:hypothetical protein [Chitinophaga solisilvae]|uniref:hypothetical protein n=1 Tax=Chitinophaga solisilvae TaxID=1233460 RepID=UPI00136DC76B|nr:hypothetical protein [Chitinophaga solisilvae]